jgi:hypothetical protein
VHKGWQVAKRGGLDQQEMKKQTKIPKKKVLK